jgi:hypothetical protein
MGKPSGDFLYNCELPARDCSLCCLLHATFLLGLFSDPEDFKTLACLSADSMASHSIRMFRDTEIPHLHAYHQGIIPRWWKQKRYPKCVCSLKVTQTFTQGFIDIEKLPEQETYSPWSHDVVHL